MDLRSCGCKCFERIQMEATSRFSFASADFFLLLFRFASFCFKFDQTNIYRGFHFSFPKLLLPDSSPPRSISPSLSFDVNSGDAVLQCGAGASTPLEAVGTSSPPRSLHETCRHYGTDLGFASPSAAIRIGQRPAWLMH